MDFMTILSEDGDGNLISGPVLRSVTWIPTLLCWLQPHEEKSDLAYFVLNFENKPPAW